MAALRHHPSRNWLAAHLAAREHETQTSMHNRPSGLMDKACVVLLRHLNTCPGTSPGWVSDSANWAMTVRLDCRDLLHENLSLWLESTNILVKSRLRMCFLGCQKWSIVYFSIFFFFFEQARLNLNPARIFATLSFSHSQGRPSFQASPVHKRKMSRRTCRLKKEGCSGNWTQDLSHPERESCH